VILQILLMALREIRRNALRSFLTMLGVVIGVGAVIGMVTLGQGATAKVQSDVASLGQNTLAIVPGADRRSGAHTSAPPFEEADVLAIEKEVPGIEAIAGTASASGMGVTGTANWSVSVTGSTNAFFTIRGYEFATGRNFSEAELAGGTPVCVLGHTVKKELWKDQDPVGQRLRIGRVSCQVIGVLSMKGAAAMGPDQDDVVVMPLRAVQRRFLGRTDVSSIVLKAADDASVGSVQTQVEAILRQRRRLGPGSDNNFWIRNPKEIADAMSSVTQALTSLLGAIAAVSLLVGGIGIMNIMLVSVTERTREIGTRLAIGARSREVLLQFLVEAIVLSTLGGLLGIGFGLTLSYVGSRMLSIPFVVSYGIIVAAFVFSALVGVLFGFLPARKAARLNPIEALRHE